MDRAAVAGRLSLAPAARLSNSMLLSLAALIVVAPVFAFAAALRPAAMAPVAAAGIGTIALFVTARAKTGSVLAARPDWRALAACLAAALLLCLLGGEGHMFFSPSDWFTRDSVLADLVRNGFPVFYRVDGQDYLLRAPLGMYLIPALVGRMSSLEAAHFALLAQNATLLGLMFYLLSQASEAPRARFLMLLVLFSPVDIVPRLAADFAAWRETGAFVLNPLTNFWNPLFKYWGQIPSLFWATNHALAGWFFGLLFLLRLRREIDDAPLALGFVALLFWSPLSMIGAAPFLALQMARTPVARLLGARNLAAAAIGLGFAPMAIYLSLDSGSITHEWLIGKSGFWAWYLALLIFSIPQAWLVLGAWRDVPRWQRPAVALAIALLMLAPFYRIGANEEYNDMAMRCTIVPLFVLGFAFCRVAPQFIAARGMLAFVCALVVTLSAVTGLLEIRRAIADPAYAINDCNLLTSTAKIYPGFMPTNYLAVMTAIPDWLLGRNGPRLEAERRVCWPGYSLLPAGS